MTARTSLNNMSCIELRSLAVKIVAFHPCDCEHGIIPTVLCLERPSCLCTIISRAIINWVFATDSRSGIREGLLLTEVCDCQTNTPSHEGIVQV